MLSQRKRSLSAKLGSKKTASPLRRRPSAPKKDWDSFQNDPNRYKLTKEEELRKKQLLVSRNNILTGTVEVGSGNYASRVQKSSVRVQTSPATAENTEKENNEVDALDLLGSDKEDHRTTPVASKKKKITPSAKKTVKPLSEEKKMASARARDVLEKTDKRKSPGAPSSGNAKLRRNLDHEYDESEASSEEENEERPARTPSPSKHRTSSSFSHSATKRSSPARFAPSSASRSTPSTAEKDNDLVYVADEVRSLFSELKYYEELSGRRSILDTREELEDMLKDEALLDPQSHKPVMRSLVQLVCQSMTYLLKSEVDLQDQRKHYEQLHAKYETLNTLLAPGSVVPNVSDFISPDTHAVSAVSSDVLSGAASKAAGIAYREDDLYPQTALWHHTPIGTAGYHGQPQALAQVYVEQRLSASASTDTSSSALRRLAQQYAQDDLYPIPADTDADECLSEEAVFTATAAPVRSSAHQMSTPVLTAKVASTPARFQEFLGGTGVQEAKAARLASNLPPGMGVQTPLRPDTASARQQNPYNSVSSTCSTPPVGLHHKKFHVTGATLGPAELYPHITTPAPYVDAYASFMPSSRKISAGQRQMEATGITTPVTGTSRVPERPQHEDHRSSVSMEESDRSAFIGADLTRVDELLAYSKRISTAPQMTFTPGGEFSTISRLADTFSAGRTPADESMLSAMAVNASALDASYMSIQQQQKLSQREADQYKHLYESHESVMSLPPPPPPSSSAHSQGPAISPVRQPMAATASRDQIMRLPTSSNNAAFTAMPGTSTSDWLFGAYPMHQAGGAAGTGMQTPTRNAQGVSSTASQPQPQGAVHDAARKHQDQHRSSPPTTKLYRGDVSTVAASQGSPRDATVDRLTQQLHSALELTAPPTPAPPAPVPAYLLPGQSTAQSSELADALTPELHPVGRAQHSAAVSKPRASSIPVKQAIVQVKKTLPVSATAKNLRSPKTPVVMAEQPTIIVPEKAAPSPHSASVHPYAQQQPLQKQLQYSQYAPSSSERGLFGNSNEGTPTGRVEARPLPGRIFDARIGSF